MKIWLTSPNVKSSALDKMWVRWAHLADISAVDLELCKPEPGMIHGELLCSIWAKIRAEEDQIQLISEIDTIPHRNFFKTMDEKLKVKRLVAANYVTRIYKDSADVHVDAGNLKEHEYSGTPLCGPWLIGFNLKDVSKWPDSNWLDAAGPFNDAANFAFRRALESGFAREEQIEVLHGRDAFPIVHGISYKNLLLHTFFARNLANDCDPAAPICWAHTKRPLTAGYHRWNVDFALKHIGKDY